MVRFARMMKNKCVGAISIRLRFKVLIIVAPTLKIFSRLVIGLTMAPKYRDKITIMTIQIPKMSIHSVSWASLTHLTAR